MRHEPLPGYGFRYCFQVCLVESEPFSFEFVVIHRNESSKLNQNGRRSRVLFSTNISEVKQDPLHVKIPLILPREEWMNLIFDIQDFIPDIFCVDSITILPSCRLKRITQCGYAGEAPERSINEAKIPDALDYHSAVPRVDMRLQPPQFLIRNDAAEHDTALKVLNIPRRLKRVQMKKKAHLSEVKKPIQVGKLYINSANFVQEVSSPGDHTELQHTENTSHPNDCDDSLVSRTQSSNKPFTFDEKYYNLTVGDEKLISGDLLAERKTPIQVEESSFDSGIFVPEGSGRSYVGDHTESQPTKIASVPKDCEDPEIAGIQSSNEPFSLEEENRYLPHPDNRVSTGNRIFSRNVYEDDTHEARFDTISVNQNEPVPRGIPNELAFKEELDNAYNELKNWLRSPLTSVEFR